jgi:putative spermidine/putrescine transport system permease protein
MRLSRRSQILLRLGTAATLAFIYVPLLVIALEAFSSSQTFKWPPPGFTLDWFEKAIDNPGARDAFLYSLRTGAIATGIALVLGTLASLAVARHRFFGRETISFLVILPIALPGIVTGIALNSTFTQVFGIDLSLFTIVVAHATFCIVVVYNNVIARLRRLSTSFEEASADLGATAWQTFRWVTLPNMRTALVAGALLAFALSFDEIIVTVFTIGAGDETLPIWILNNFSRPNQLPIVNVVAVLVILISIIPVYLAHRLTRDEGAAPGAAGAAPAPAATPAAATATPQLGGATRRAASRPLRVAPSIRPLKAPPACSPANASGPDGSISASARPGPGEIE